MNFYQFRNVEGIPAMNKLFTSVAIATSLCAAIISVDQAEAKKITATVNMKSFRGPPAYVALYLTKPNGQFHSTVAVRGGKQKYRRHLRGWFRGVSKSGRPVDGVSGASVGSGRSFEVQADIADALLNAGYKLHVDTAVEDVADYRGEATLELNPDKSQASARGKGFVKSVTISH